jgi:hypothetical protein
MRAAIAPKAVEALMDKVLTGAVYFPMSDAPYGLTLDSTENFGINVGVLAPRGERNMLIASLDALLAPFFPLHNRADRGGHRRPDRPPDGRQGGLRAPSAALESSDEESRCTFNNVVAFFWNLKRDRSDPSSAPP